MREAIGLFVLLTVFAGYGSALSRSVWREGFEYVYDYKTQTLTGIPHLSNQASGIGFRSNVVIQVPTQRELVVRMKDVQVARAANEVFTSNWMKGRRVPFKYSSLKEPALEEPFTAFLSEDGLVQRLSTSAKDSSWSVNIKRALVSQLSLDAREVLRRANDTSDESYENDSRTCSACKCFTVAREPSVAGECDTHYTVEPVAEMDTDFTHDTVLKKQERMKPMWVVTKTKDYHNCQRHHAPIFGSLSSPFEINENRMARRVERLPDRTSSWRCRLSRNSSDSQFTVMEEIGAENTFLIHPYTTNKESVNVVSYQTLELKSLTPISQPIALEISTLRQRKMTFEWEHELESSTRKMDKTVFPESLFAAKASKEKLKRGAKELVEEVTKEVLSTEVHEKEKIQGNMIRLSEVLRVIPLSLIESLYTETTTNDTTGKLKQSILLDGMVMSGTPANVFVLKDVVARGQVTGEQANQLIMALPNTIKDINSDVLRELLAMIRSVESRDEQLWFTSILSVANILHRWILVSEKHWQQQEETSNFPEALLEYASYVEKKILEVRNPSTQAILVQALGNLRSPVAFPVLRDIAEGHITPCKLVRSKAIIGLAQIHAPFSERMTQQVQSIIKPLFSNQKEDPQVRMSAFLAMLIWNPSQAFFVEAASGTWFETNKQINHFVYNALSSLAGNSSHPGFSEVSHMAAMALPLAEPVNLRLPYSSYRIESHMIPTREYGHLWNSCQFKSQFSLLPDQVYHVMYNYAKGIYKPILETTLQTEGSQTLLNNLISWRYEQQLPRLPGLDIKPRKDYPFHGNFWIRLMGSMERAFNLDGLSQWVRDGLMDTEGRLHKQTDINYFKTIALEQERVVLTVETGFPVYVKKTVPVTASVRGTARINMTASDPSVSFGASINAESAFVMSQIVETGILSPVTEDVFQSGHETKLILHTPAKMSISYNNQTLRFRAEQHSMAPRTLSALSIKFLPFTAQAGYQEYFLRPNKKIVLDKHPREGRFHEPDFSGLEQSWKPSPKSALQVKYYGHVGHALSNFETIRELANQDEYFLSTKLTPTLKASWLTVNLDTSKESSKSVDFTLKYDSRHPGSMLPEVREAREETIKHEYRRSVPSQEELLQKAKELRDAGYFNGDSHYPNHPHSEQAKDLMERIWLLENGYHVPDPDFLKERNNTSNGYRQPGSHEAQTTRRTVEHEERNNTMTGNLQAGSHEEKKNTTTSDPRGNINAMIEEQYLAKFGFLLPDKYVDQLRRSWSTTTTTTAKPSSYRKRNYAHPRSPYGYMNRSHPHMNASHRNSVHDHVALNEFEFYTNSSDNFYALHSDIRFGRGAEGYSASVLVSSSPDKTIWKASWDLMNLTSRSNLAGYAEIKYPRLPVSRPQILQVMLTTRGFFKVRVNHEGAINSTLYGSIDLSQTPDWHQRALRSPEAKECSKYEQNGEPYVDICLRAREQALTLNKMEVAITSTKLSKTLRAMAHHADDFLKAYFYPHMKNAYLFGTANSTNSTVRIAVQVPLSRSELIKSLNLNIEKPGENTTFEDIKPVAPLKAMLPLHVEYPTLSRTIDNLLGGEYNKFCEVQKEWIRTYDNVSYKYPLGDCDHLLTRDCSDRIPIQVLARQDRGGKLLNITVGDLAVQVTPDREVWLNGFRLTIPLYGAVSVQNSLGGDVLQVVRQKVSKLVLIAPKHGMKMLADGKNVQIQMSNMYRGRLCGLCGDMNGETFGELKDPHGCILNNAHQFGISYAVQPCALHFAQQTPIEDCVTDDHRPAVPAAVPKFGGRVFPPTSFGSKSVRPVYHNKVVVRGTDICFSIRAVPDCPLKSKPDGFLTGEVGFHCVVKGRTANAMIAQARTSVIGSLEIAKVDFRQYVSYPKSCVQIPESYSGSQPSSRPSGEPHLPSPPGEWDPRDIRFVIAPPRTNVTDFPHNATALLNPTFHHEIIDGTPLPSTRTFPHQVRVLSSGGMCGGTIVTASYVMTAAHCIPFGVGRARIQAGIGSGMIQTIEGRSTQHPNYPPPNSHLPISSDIGFIRLDRPLEFNEFVQPACVYCGREEMNEIVNISGYGIIDFDRWNRPIYPRDTLYFAPQRVTRHYGPPPMEPPNQFMGLSDPSSFTPPHKASCSGDSGGPASVLRRVRDDGAYEWTVLGVTSFGFTGNNGQLQCGGIGPGGSSAHDVRSYYTRTSSFCSWLRSRIPGLRTTLTLSGL